MITYLERLLDITVTDVTNPSDWKRATVFPIYNGRNRSVDTNCRPVSLNSVVCKQVELVIAGNLRQVWDTNEWLYESNMDFDRDASAKANSHNLSGHS